jgi:DNA-directed RNA polymerase subunit E'/Rpb7
MSFPSSTRKKQTVGKRNTERYGTSIAKREHSGSIFSKMLITKTVHLGIRFIGDNLMRTLEEKIADEVEGRCSVEGLIKNGSSKIVTFSSGLVTGDAISFEVVFECLVCLPVEGMHISCVAKNITKAGIRALSKEEPSPIMVFVARDHHTKSRYYSSVKENADIVIRVIGQRFELHDKYISIIAELIEPHKPKLMLKNPRKLIISEK